jgi:hypothetical protein
MKASKQTEVNLLDLFPRRTVEFTTDADGKVTIVVPRFKREWMRRMFAPKRKGPNINVALDAFGSSVWQKCDGKTTVGGIADQLRAEFGEAVEPADERVAAFVKQLLGNSFITLDIPAMTAEPAPRTTTQNKEYPA